MTLPADEGSDGVFISIRTPAWGVTPLPGWFVTDQFISIRTPRVGGDQRCPQRDCAGHISIRTPAWGVTPLPVRKAICGTHFNSHPRVGGDKGSRFLLRFLGNFNSHPRVGGDEIPIKILKYLMISIRTPAWGVTSNHSPNGAL